MDVPPSVSAAWLAVFRQAFDLSVCAPFRNNVLGEIARTAADRRLLKVISESVKRTIFGCRPHKIAFASLTWTAAMQPALHSFRRKP